jgi:capsular exopolysaccharide synthesis family protein
LEQLNTIAGKFQSHSLQVAVLAQAGMLSSNSATYLAASLGAPPPNETSAPKGEVMLVKWFEQHVKIELRRNSRLIDISVTDGYPDRSARLANAIVQEYFKQDFAIKSATSKTVGEFFKSEYDRLRQKVQAAGQARQDYEEEVGTVLVTSSQEDDIQEFRKQLQLTAARAEVIRCQAAYEGALKMGTNVEELLAYPAIAKDPQVELYETGIARCETNLMSLREEYREKNPKYIEAVNSLNGIRDLFQQKLLSLRQQIQEAYRIPLENAQKTVAGLENEAAAYQTKSMDLDRKKIRYALLVQEATAESNLLTAVSTRLGEMTADAQLAPTGISVISWATPPATFSSPRTALLIVLGFVGSLVFACSLVLFLDALNTSLRTVDAAESYLGVPVLAAIPELKVNQKDHQSQLVVVGKHARAADAELFRTLRSSLRLSGKEEQRTFLFTSSFPNEGKTFAACNFAASLAQQGFRTLVLDLDLRRPRVEEFFTGDSKKTPGVAEVLKQGLKLSEVAQVQPEAVNLSWVAAGNLAPGQVELLSREVFGKLLAEAVTKYDRVVIDTPPIHPVKDALLVAKEADLVIVIVDGCKTARKAAAKTMQWLRNANAPVAGVVLNRMPHRRSGGGFAYDEYVGYGYGTYGDSGKSPAGRG